jgi:hypothetical protein
MTTPQDAPLLAALEIQYSALAPIVERVTGLRSRLASATPSEWRGQARQAFEAADHAVGLAIDTAEEAARRAYVLTGSALRTVDARG